MQKEKQLVPQLRFTEFDGKWEKKKFGETVIINPKITELPNSFIYIDLESVNNGVLSKENKISKNEAPSRAQRLLSNDDILYQTVRPYQKNNFYFNKSKNDYVASTGYAQIRSKHNKSSFIYQYLHSDYFVNKVLLRCTGTSYPAINSTDLSKIRVNFPPVPEQQKIADFLSSIDTHIQTLEKKKAALELYKKSVTQKIFKQEIRFKDDDGNEFADWEKRKVGEIFKITRGDVLSMKLVEQRIDENYKYPVYSSKTMKKGLSGYYNQYLFEDAITWTTDGANAGDVNYRKGKFYCTNVCGVLLNDKGYANLFVAEKLNSITKKYVSYVGNPKLMNGVMSEIKINLPSVKEQTKIANFLSSIDKQIEGITQQIEYTKTYKKGLLQQMFV